MGTITQLPSRPEPKPESLRERFERACIADPKLRAADAKAGELFQAWLEDPEGNPDIATVMMLNDRRRRVIRLLPPA